VCLEDPGLVLVEWLRLEEVFSLCCVLPNLLFIWLLHKDLQVYCESWLEFNWLFEKMFVVNPAGVLCELAVVWL